MQSAFFPNHSDTVSEVQVRGQTTGGPSQRRALGMEELRVENAALHRRVAKQERLLKTLEIQMSREKGAEELNADDDMSDDEYANPECPLDLEYILQYETEEHARSVIDFRDRNRHDYPTDSSGIFIRLKLYGNAAYHLDGPLEREYGTGHVSLRTPQLVTCDHQPGNLFGLAHAVYCWIYRRS